MQAVAGRTDLLPRLGELTACPTLVVTGTEDRATPPALAHMIAKGLPGAHLEILEATGHLSAMERPERITALVLAHLGTCAPT